MSNVKKPKRGQSRRTRQSVRVRRKPVPAVALSAKAAKPAKTQTQLHQTAVRPDTPTAELFVRSRIDSYGAPPIRQTGSWRLVPVSARLWFRNYDVCIALFILPLLAIVLGSILAPDLTNISSRTLAGVLLIVAGILWLIVNAPATCYLQVKAIQGDTPSVRECYRRSWRFIPRLIGLVGLVSLLAFGGLLLLVVPGVIVIRRYLLSPYYLVGQDLGIRAAMARSAADSKPVALSIWGVFAVFMVINAFCVIMLSPIAPPYGSLLGAFITSLYSFGPALRYREVGLRKPASLAIEGSLSD